MRRRDIPLGGRPMVSRSFYRAKPATFREDGGRRTEVGGRRTEDRGQRTEDRGQMWNALSQLPNFSTPQLSLAAQSAPAPYPLGDQECCCQKLWSETLLPLKILRSALRMLATPTGNALRGRRPHFPSPVYCQRCQFPQGLMPRGCA